MTTYKHNHFVPISYQKRFMLPGETKYYRLDLYPETIVQGGHKFTRDAVHYWSPKRIFAEDDLYTTRWGQTSNREIEQFFSAIWTTLGQRRSITFVIFVTRASTIASRSSLSSYDI
jgi:hypothetical protein